MILAIDIGGTTAKMALLDHAGHITVKCHEISTCVNHYNVPIIVLVVNEVEKFLNETAVKLEGIAVSATGQIDMETGVVIGTNDKITCYEGTRIAETLEEKFHVPVSVLNDANAAALGECIFGRARGCKNAVMVTIGTGVGGGIIIDSRVYGGRCGIAGEIGHFTLYQDGPKCTCGKRGCYECYASTSALVRMGTEMNGGNVLNGKEIFTRAHDGDERMLKLLDRWIDDIAAGISGLVHIFNPEMILIGGGVSTQTNLLIDPLRRKVKAQLMPRFAEKLQIESATLGNDAGMIGAVAFWMQKYTGKYPKV